MTIHQLKTPCWVIRPQLPREDGDSHYDTRAKALAAIRRDWDEDHWRPVPLRAWWREVRWRVSRLRRGAPHPRQKTGRCWLVQCDGECGTVIDEDDEGYIVHHRTRARHPGSGPVRPRCGRPMRRIERDVPVLEDPACGRPSGHPGRHRSEASVRTMRVRRRADYDRPTGSPFIAAKIREAREQAGASQSALAAVLGVTQQCVYGWEAARCVPSEENWEQLELTLGPLGVVREAAPEPGTAKAGRSRAA